MMPLTERVLRAVSPEPNTGCWLWTLGFDRWGYSRINTRPSGGSTTALAHRVSYEAFVGAIPAGHTLDHLCRVRCCVNPAHLEPVTQNENVRRGAVSRRRLGIRTARATVRADVAIRCINGHERTPENTYRYGRGFVCRTCNREASRKRLEKLRARALAKETKP